MTDTKREVSELDKKYFQMLRDDVSNFMKNSGLEYDAAGSVVLDIAPQDHEGAKPYFPLASVETLDIDPESGATYIADLCKNNASVIPADHFDIVVCTEVLEHTLNPFLAVDEIKRILKPGGIALISTPYNFRIHGPLPDCWRFTEHGLRALFKDFEHIALDALEDDDRFLMPIHYTFVVRKGTGENNA
ncbi:MAG: methyltransferase [Candidatus Saccharibacteria bacterium]|nr:methyltransferase [Candidatus Saccharibacteria bacterium]